MPQTPSFSVILHSISAADYLLHAIPLYWEQLGPKWPQVGSACNCFSLCPAQTSYPGPDSQWATLISGEATCTGVLSHLSREDSYLLRSTAFGAVDCKRRNFRLENCGHTCLHGIFCRLRQHAPRLPQSPANGKEWVLSSQVSHASSLEWMSCSLVCRGNVGSVSETLCYQQ